MHAAFYALVISIAPNHALANFGEFETPPLKSKDATQDLPSLEKGSTPPSDIPRHVIEGLVNPEGNGPLITKDERENALVRCQTFHQYGFPTAAARCKQALLERTGWGDEINAEKEEQKSYCATMKEAGVDVEYLQTQGCGSGPSQENSAISNTSELTLPIDPISEMKNQLEYDSDETDNPAGSQNIDGINDKTEHDDTGIFDAIDEDASSSNSLPPQANDVQQLLNTLAVLSASNGKFDLNEGFKAAEAAFHAFQQGSVIQQNTLLKEIHAALSHEISELKKAQSFANHIQALAEEANSTFAAERLAKIKRKLDYDKARQLENERRQHELEWKEEQEDIANERGWQTWQNLNTTLGNLQQQIQNNINQKQQIQNNNDQRSQQGINGGCDPRECLQSGY